MYKTERKEIAKYMRRLYKNGLTTASGGNISQKIDDVILLTPSQVDKGKLKWKDVAVIDKDANIIESHHNLSMETQMHLEIYKARPDISAIVHSHPPFASAYACSEEIVDTTITGEILYVCGIPKKADYFLMGSKELANSISEAIKNTDIVVMNNHGVVIVASNLFNAYDMMEVYEGAAKINYYLKTIGKKVGLSKEEQKKILDIKKAD